MALNVWIGLAMAIGLMVSGLMSAGAGHLVNTHGLVIVVGGTLAASLVNSPFRIIASALFRLLSILVPPRTPSVEEAIEEAVRLARAAQAGGGLLSLQDEGHELAGGFLHRAITVAIATGESHRTRDIIERQIKQVRIGRQEDANFFRTVGVLSPMFGILGTLMGMIQVLGSLTDPSKVGPAMALALSSAFLGISIANFICVPVAGQIRIMAQRETLIFEVLLEGVLDIAAGRPPYVIELNLSSYSARRREELERAEGRPEETRAGAEA